MVQAIPTVLSAAADFFWMVSPARSIQMVSPNGQSRSGMTFRRPAVDHTARRDAMTSINN
jgi:hypothetical protein